jgi:3-phenylpropionate/trans-cinnamate dioxygenase ferredoxin reductase subunit
MVDEFCRTTDPDVLAVGDCTNHPNPLLGRRLRLESVHNAQEQAKTAAATILGRLEPYAQIPWFWSDQYDIKLQIVGFSSRSEQAVFRGDPGSRSFAVFFLDEGRLTSVYAINSPREFMLSKKLIALGARPEAALLRDTTVPFKEIAEGLES